VVDPHHPLYGKCFPVSDRRSGRGLRLIVVRLPDGRERGISRLATAPTSASDDLAAAAPSRQVHISVRTLNREADQAGPVKTDQLRFLKRQLSLPVSMMSQ
jgi:hypothetical protein